MKNTYYYLLAFLLLISVTVGCKKDNNDPLPENTTDIFIKASDPHVNEVVKVLNNNMLSHVTNVSDSELVIEQTSATENQVTEGDIIVADVSDKFPYGALRKIETISTNGKSITVKTSLASLNDVFKYGRIEINQPLSDTINSPGNARMALSVAPRMQVAYSYDRDKNPATQNDQITISATGMMTPNLIFEWEKVEGASSPDHVKMKLENNVQLGVQIFAKIDQIDLRNQLLYLWKYKPVSKVVYGVPIVLYPELRMYTELSIPNPVETQLGFGVSQKLSSGFLYQDGAWDFSKTDELNPAFITPPSINDSFTVHGTVLHFELTAAPYGIDSMKTNIGTKFDAGNNFDCATKSFKVDFNGKADFSLKSQFSFFSGLGNNNQDIRQEVNLFSKNLKSGSILCSGGN